MVRGIADRGNSTTGRVVDLMRKIRAIPKRSAQDHCHCLARRNSNVSSDRWPPLVKLEAGVVESTISAPNGLPTVQPPMTNSCDLYTLSQAPCGSEKELIPIQRLIALGAQAFVDEDFLRLGKFRPGK